MVHEYIIQEKWGGWGELIRWAARSALTMLLGEG